MKHLIKKVDLVFFQDDANGEWGLAHKETFDDNYGNGFNAFWNGIGIFHDVFEHSHEFTNKYFRGDYALNIGGEMTAMGAMWYYFETLGVSNRMNYGGYYYPSQSMRMTTEDLIHESISEGYGRYGSTLESNVPFQRPVENSELECQIREFAKNVKGFRLSESNRSDENSVDASKVYKKSVTFRKIADLHRYGFRMAERLVPDTSENAGTLIEFLNFWNEFCKNNSAETLAGNFKGIEVKLYKENGAISWKAILKASNGSGIKNIELTERMTGNIENEIYDYLLEY